MNWIGSLLWILPRRLSSSWTLLAITGFGVLAAVTLMSLGAVYTRALAEAGLQHSLASTSREILNTHIIAQNRPLGPSDYDTLRSNMEEILQDRLGYMIRDVQRYGRPQPEILLVDEPLRQSQLLGAPSARPFFKTDFQEHTRLIDGRWPSPVAKDNNGRLSIEVAVGEDTATVMFWELGSEAIILPYRSDLDQQIHVEVVGLIEPLDTDEEYWMGFYDYFGPQEAGEIVLMPMYVPEGLFFDGIGARYPALVGDFGWYVFLDTDVLNADQVQPTRNDFKGMESDINKRVPRSLILTRLENSRDTGLLAQYQRAVTRARAPIYLFISLVVVVILYFLALVTGLLAQTRSEEAGLLRSRGASMFQVGSVITVAEALLVAAATLVGPFLAMLIFQLALFATIDPKGGSEALEVGLRTDMFIMGAVGGLMSLVVLLGANFNLTRLGLLDFLREKARPPTVPFLQRYYIDGLVVFALGVVWWQIEQRGSFLQRTLSTNDNQLDPSLLVAPSLALLTAAFLVLRVLPLVVRVLALAARVAAPAWASFALSRVARDPLPYGSLTVIVMLAAALGVFGASFQSTLGRSQEEQALYQAGGDLEVHVIAPTSDTVDNLASSPVVHSFTPVQRDSVTLLDAIPGSSAGLLAFDPVSLADITWFRQDFSLSGKNLSELITPLRRGQSRLPDLGGNLPSGIPIPEDAEGIGVWVNTETFAESSVQQSLSMWLRIADADGSYENLDMGDVELSPGGLVRTQGRSQWTYYEAPLPLEKVWLDPPFNVVALYFVGRSLYRMPPGSIYLDDISVKLTPSPGQPSVRVIENFDDVGRWVPLPHDGDVADGAVATTRAGRGDGQGMEFTWEDPLLQDARGILIPPGDFPLAAVGSSGLPVGQTLRLNMGRQLVPVVVEESVTYFPTMHQRNIPFMLVSLKSLEDYTSRIPRGNASPPREYWIALEQGVDIQESIRAVREATSISASIRDRSALLERYQRDPLSGGGWNGLTLLGLGTLTLVVTLALATHAIVAVNGAKVELTVTRALGFSRRQLVSLLVLERVLVAGIGLAAGAILGYYLGRWTLGYMGLTPSGLPIVPPMVFTVQAWLVALVIVNLVAAAALAAVVAAITVGRLRVSDILRSRV